MLYKTINIKFNSLWQNDTKLSYLLKGENHRKGENSNFSDVLTSDFKNVIEINYEVQEKDFLSSFTSHKEEGETLENKNAINVSPEKVNVLDNVFEYAKQTLEDFYEKGSEFLESLCNEHAIAVVKSHDDTFVDIILKDNGIHSREDDQILVKEENICPTDSVQDVMKSVDAICQSCKNNSLEYITFSHDTQGILDDISKSMYSSDITAAVHNESHLMDFPVLFDKSRANIFNSTEIDSPVFEASFGRACKALSPSEINIFDSLCNSCISAGSNCGNGLRSSSLSINPNSFPSVSSINIRSRCCSSSRVSPNMENTDHSMLEESFCTDPIRMRQDSDIIRRSYEMIAGSLKNQTREDELHFHTEPKCSMKTIGFILPGEPHVEDTDAQEEQTDYTQCGNPAIYDSSETLSFSISANDACNEMCILDSDETTLSDTRVLKKKSSHKLRHRMSGIFNNLRGVNLMQCVMSSAKRQKMYRKQTNGCDA